MIKKMVMLLIDDKHVQVPAGTTIHTAAKEVGINIPTSMLPKFKRILDV